MWFPTSIAFFPNEGCAEIYYSQFPVLSTHIVLDMVVLHGCFPIAMRMSSRSLLTSRIQDPGRQKTWDSNFETRPVLGLEIFPRKMSSCQAVSQTSQKVEGQKMKKMGLRKMTTSNSTKRFCYSFQLQYLDKRLVEANV